MGHQSYCGILLCCFLGFSAWAADVKFVTGKDADFATYKTYQWLPTRILTSGGVVEDEPVTTPLVKEAVNKQLAAKGLKEVASGGDLQVSTMILTESSAQLEAIWFPGSYAYQDGGAAPVTIGRYNKHGTLLVNLIDTRTMKSAWAAMASRSISSKPGGGQGKIPQAAADCFKKYPVTKRK